MTTDFPSRQPAPLVDPTYYADLWGNTGAAAHRRDAWRGLRSTAVKLAAVAIVGLVGYVAVTSALTEDGTDGPLPAGASVAPTETD